MSHVTSEQVATLEKSMHDRRRNQDLQLASMRVLDKLRRASDRVEKALKAIEIDKISKDLAAKHGG